MGDYSVLLANLQRFWEYAGAPAGMQLRRWAG